MQPSEAISNASAYAGCALATMRRMEQELVAVADAEMDAFRSSAYVAAIDWILRVSAALKPTTMAATPFLAAHLLDAYVRANGSIARRMTKAYLRKVATCAFVLASKYEDVEMAERADMVRVGAKKLPVISARTAHAINANILQATNWRLTVPTVAHFVEEFCTAVKAKDSSENNHAALVSHALSLARLTLRDPAIHAHLRSMIALGCALLALEGRVAADGVELGAAADGIELGAAADGIELCAAADGIELCAAADGIESCASAVEQPTKRRRKLASAVDCKAIRMFKKWCPDASSKGSSRGSDSGAVLVQYAGNLVPGAEAEAPSLGQHAKEARIVHLQTFAHYTAQEVDEAEAAAVAAAVAAVLASVRRCVADPATEGLRRANADLPVEGP